MARLPGSVHGVVVQITTDAPCSSFASSRSPSSSTRAAPAHAGDRKLHPHRVAGEILVLDLGFGERGLLHHRPHHRLRAAIEQPVVAEFHQLAGDLRLGGEVHGGVGMLPVAGDAESLELLALHGRASARHRRGIHGETRSSPRDRRSRASACPSSDSSPPRSSIRSAGRGSPSRARRASRSRASAGSASPRP